MSEIKLNEEDRKKLTELYQTAHTTPEDMASIAWDNVRKCMDKLGKKYGYNPAICTIGSKTGIAKEVQQNG